MPGEGYALICTFLWALSSAMLKSQTDRVGILHLGALRTFPAVLIYWGLLLFTGRLTAVTHLPISVWGYLVGSSLIGLVVGDMIYIKSLKLIGLSRAMPLSATFPFFTMLWAAVFLDEQIGWTMVAGATLIAGGAYLVAVSPESTSDPQPVDRKEHTIGVALALATAFCWSLSTTLLRLGGDGIAAEVVNAVRLSVLLGVLFVLLAGRNQVRSIAGYGRRTLSFAVLTGIIGPGLGAYMFVTAVQLAGAARTSVLTAATPLFGVPFSFLLKEKPSPRTLLGTALTVAGVCLTVF